MFKLAANVVTAIVVAWWVSVILTSILTCNPITGFWEKVYTIAKCIDTKFFFVGNAVSNIVTDLIILALPLWQIWHLHMQRCQKIALSFIFMSGGL